MLPMADKDWPPGTIGIGNRGIARRRIAGAVFGCRPRLLGASNAVQAELFEFCEHRSPPIPLIAVGERWEATTA
jgi:hypothetical protein